MWATDSLWFEVAIVSFIFAAGNILFGHFEEQTPKLRRIAKFLLALAVICLLSVYFGRTAAMIVLSLMLLPVIVVHAWYLPKKKGINGFTGEPKRRYYEFRKWDTNIFKEKDDE